MLVPPESEKRRIEENRQNEVIEGLLDNFDVEEAEGDNVTIDDCIQAPTKIKICGKQTKQEKRQGYNKLFIDKVKSDSLNGLDVNINENEIYLNGTTNAKVDLYLIGSWGDSTENEKRKLKASNYTLINYGDSNTNTSINMYFNTNLIASLTKKDIQTFSLDSEMYYSVLYISIPINATFNNITFKLALLEGEYTLENAPSFEKFGQSPSSEYPSPLEYVKGNQTINHINENLVSDIDCIYSSANYGNLKIKVENGKIIVNGTPTTSYVSISKTLDITDLLEDGETYTLVNFGGLKVYNQIHASNSITGASVYYHTSEKPQKSFTVDKSKYTKYHYNIQTFLVNSVGTLDNYICNFMLVKGNTYMFEEYVPHKSQTYQLTNLPPLYSENDCIVYLEADDKKTVDGEGWYVYNEWNKENFNGSEDWSLERINEYGIANFRIAKEIAEKLEYEYPVIQMPLMTNFNVHRSLIADTKENGFLFNDAKQFYIRIDSAVADTVEKFKVWLSENNQELAYKLSTPKYTKITDEVLIKQLDELRKMISYKGQNNFIVTSENGQKCNLKVTAYKNSIKIIKDEINNLKALVLENIVS